MAKHGEFDKKLFAEWVASRPKCIQELVAKLPPDELYRMKSTGQRVTIYSYNEGGTVSVNVSGDFNLTIFDRTVFGVKPEDLEVCELPGENEVLGAVLTDDAAIDKFCDDYRKETSFRRN